MGFTSFPTLAKRPCLSSGLDDLDLSPLLEEPLLPRGLSLLPSGLAERDLGLSSPRNFLDLSSELRDLRSFLVTSLASGSSLFLPLEGLVDLSSDRLTSDLRPDCLTSGLVDLVGLDRLVLLDCLTGLVRGGLPDLSLEVLRRLSDVLWLSLASSRGL